MQTTLNRCLAVVFGLLMLLALPASRFSEPVTTQWVSAPDSGPLHAADELDVTHIRLTNYLKAHWKAPAELAQVVIQTAAVQSQATGLPLTLILAMIAKESSFRPDAQSSYGAMGLMQVVPRFHPEKLEGRPEDALLNPEHNIEVGALVLNEYLTKAKGDARRALRKYSGGANAYYERVTKYQAQFDKVSQDDAYSHWPPVRKKRREARGSNS